MKKPIKRIATVHDLCGIGKASLTNIIPVLSTLGMEVCPIPTIILSTHTGGFGIPKIINLKGYISDAFKHYSEIKIDFEGIFIGYLGSINNIKAILNFFETQYTKNALVVLDPIFGDNGNYYSNFDSSYSDELKKLIRYSKIITPNFTEACILADEEIPLQVSEEKLLYISRKLYKLGCESVIITSVPLNENNKIGTSIYDGLTDSIYINRSTKLEKSYPGTGDIFTSVLIGRQLQGMSLIQSVKDSCRFVERCISKSIEYDYPTKEGVLLEFNLKYLI